MRKLFLSLAIAAVAAGSAAAQITVGAGYLNQTTVNSISENTSSDGTMHGFYVGAGFSWPLVAGLSIDSGVSYNYLVSNEDILGAGFLNSKTENSILEIPVNLRYRFHAASFLDIFALAGPRFNVGLASTTTASVLDLEKEINNYGEDSNLQRFDFGLGAGIGFELFQLVRLDVGYDWGLLDLNKTEAVTTRNSRFHVGLAVMF